MKVNNFSHTPVLLNEAISALNVKVGGKYVDATLGGGGHTSLILERGGMVLGLDKDKDALDYVLENLKPRIRNQELRIVHSSFSNIAKVAKENGYEKADGVLMDLGVSSYQLDNSGRGFSIKKNEELDMRMDSKSKISAYDIVNTYSKENLIEIFSKYGEEHNAREIADRLVLERKKGAIATADELAKIVEKVSHKDSPIHPATKIFQAIRIEVNNELEELKIGLKSGLELLNPNGRIVTISFHSLEDRIVKQTFGRYQKEGFGRVVTKKPVLSTNEEIKQNKRSRSAKMRVFEKN